LRVLTVQPRCRKQRNPAVQLALSNLCNQYLPERRKAERLYDLVCVRLVSSGRPPQRARCCTVCVCYAFTESGLPTRAWFFGRTRTCSSSTSSNTEWFLQASLQKKKGFRVPVQPGMRQLYQLWLLASRDGRLCVFLGARIGALRCLRMRRFSGTFAAGRGALI